MADLHIVAQIQEVAATIGDAEFLELLRWHRAVIGLPDLDWSSQGAYRTAITELGDDRAADLLRDLRRAARDPRRHRHGADGKPVYSGGRTLADHRRHQ
ncbi:hypothetical protein [Dietzia sp. NCCP-2495]|uniref:hypothetical protein n=1 Tax=Dietzia sp. NCCP-2495 TaxID=2934675 RepID=UPI0022300702|nr:hypothetical protein [Dietzia sp. NCCP-2495]